MQSGTIDKIKSVVISRFTIEDIIDAKDMLWAVAGVDTIGDRKRRRDGTNKSEKESHTNDILQALIQLDAAALTPIILVNAMDLGSIPRSHPEELNDISMADRLNRMETRLAALTQVVDHNVANNMDLKEQMSSLQDKQNNSVTYAGVMSQASNARNISTTSGSNISSSLQLPKLVPSRVELRPNTDVRPRAPNLTGTHKLMPAHIRQLSASNQSLATSTISDNEMKNDGFSEPSHVIRKHRRQENQRQRYVARGSRTGGSIRGAPAPRRDVFVYRVDSETTTEMMSKHIKDIGIDIISINCVSNPSAKFKSFRITASVTNYHELLKAENWSEGIYVRKYTTPRRGENTEY